MGVIHYSNVHWKLKIIDHELDLILKGKTQITLASYILISLATRSLMMRTVKLPCIVINFDFVR